MKILISIVLIWFSAKHVLTLDCFWNNGNNYKYFATKTPYEFLRGDIRDSVVNQQGCEPVSIWALIRHGQRNPGKDFQTQMRAALVIKDYIVSSYEEGNSSLCAQDVENLRNWKVNMDIFDKPSELTKEGYQESKGIARRLKQAFPKLLEKLENDSYLIRPARGYWIEESAKGFIEGFSDNQLIVQPPRIEFDILTPYATCSKYRDVKNSPETYAEANKYLNSSEFLTSKDRIRRRLGIDYPLTDSNITALYDLCRYTSSGLTNTLSPWCALFTTEDLKIQEYIADVRQYYRCGYGTPINELFGQITLTDLFKSLQNAKNGNRKKITANFTHATLMKMVYTALKLFKHDAPLTSSYRKPDRKWRSSKLTAFSANLIAILNKCNNGTDDYNILFYMNEEPLQSICNGGVCTWKEFEDKLLPFLNTNTDFCEYAVLIPIVLFWFYLKYVLTFDCYWNNGCNYKYFSSKTPYEIVRGDIRDSIVKKKGCEPVSIWALIRHGQRNPGKMYGEHMRSAIAVKDYIVTSYDKGNCSLCAQDVENLRNWQVNMDIFDKPITLTKEGYQESEGIGRRLKQAFPRLLENIERNNYLIRPAHWPWIEDSAKGFAEGLNKQLTVQPSKTDFDVLAPFETCSKYLNDVKNNPETYTESVRYRSSPEFLASKERIQKRLGINYPLTDTNITALYDLCRYTLSGQASKFSPWCALFTVEDFKVMEYVEDLRIYYRNGYGTPMNKLLGQISLTDLLKSFQEVKRGKGNKITTYLTHTTVMAMVYTALDLFKDDALLLGLQNNPDHKWRSSKLSVFSSNLIAVLNKCDNGAEDYNVVFYMNEEPLQSICNGGICTWKEFVDMLSPFLKTNTAFCEYGVETSTSAK